MQRRSLLTSLSVGVAGLAGCVGSPLDVGSDGHDSMSPADVWGEKPPCPAVDPTADVTVCTGGGHPKPAGVPVTLQPPVDTPLQRPPAFTVTLRPRGEVPLTFAPGDWTLRRRSDDGWRDVTAGKGPSHYTTIYPGEQYDWVVGPADGRAVGADATHVERSLGTGRYACSVTASVGRGWTDGDRFECVTLFSVR